MDEKVQRYSLSSASPAEIQISSNSAAALDSQLAGLRALVSDDPNEQPASDAIAQAIARRSAIFADAIASRGSLRPVTDTDSLIKDKLQPAFADISARLDAMLVAENNLLVERLEAKRQAFYVAMLFIAGCFLLAIAIIVVVTSFLEKTAGNLAEASDERRLATARLDGLNRSFEMRVASRTAALQENAALLESIIDAVDDGVVGCDSEFRTTRVNQAAARLLSASPETFDMRTWANQNTVTSGDDSIPLPLPELPIIQATRGEAAERVELCVTNPKIAGQTWLEVSAHPTRDAQDNITGAVAIFRDIGERKRSQESLRKARDIAVESARIRSEFLGNISRDLRTPLNGILGTAELLGLTNLDPRQRELADTISASSEMLLAIANQIQDFSKTTTSKALHAAEEIKPAP
jgi:signal transduction histidine kinase